jgi:hypothetical protein
VGKSVTDFLSEAYQPVRSRTEQVRVDENTELILDGMRQVLVFVACGIELVLGSLGVALNPQKSAFIWFCAFNFFEPSYFRPLPYPHKKDNQPSVAGVSGLLRGKDRSAK